MNFLNKYSKLSRLSYTSVRTFAYNSNRYNAPIGSGTQNTTAGTDSTGIGIRSASPSYNSSSTGGSGRNPEYITSTDTRFNSFSASGPTSGFTQSDSQDLGSSNKSFAGSTASSLKDLADQAANTAKGFVDQTASGQMRSSGGDFMNTAASVAQGVAGTAANFAGSAAQGLANAASSFGGNTERQDTSYSGNERDYSNAGNRNRSQNPLDDLVNSANSVAQGFGNLAQGAVSAATSFGSNFIPRDTRDSTRDAGNQNAYEDRRPAYYDEHDYNRDASIRNSGRYGHHDSRYNSYDSASEIGKFVDSTATNIQNATNQASNRARDSFDQMTGNNFTSQTGDFNNSAVGSTLTQAQALAGTAANLAGYAVKGMMDNAAYFASAFMPSSASSSSSSTYSPHTERSASFNSQNTNNYSYNPNNIGTENKNVEHFTSTDTRYNAWSTVGHVSGFGSRNFTNQDFSSNARNFADSAASNIKRAVDQAAGTANGFVDRGNSYVNNSTGNPAADMMNQAASTAQEIAGQAAYAVGSTLNTFVNVASSLANSLVPAQGGQNNQYGNSYNRQRERETYGRDQNYMNNYGERQQRPQNFTSTDTGSNFFNPGQGSGNHPVSPFENPIGSFVSSFTQGNPINSMIQGAVNTGFNMASGFVPGSQNPNFFRQNQYSGSESRSRNVDSEVAMDSAVKGAIDVAKGVFNTANSIASAFIPGAGQNRNPSR